MGLGLFLVGGRPVFNEALGRFFRELREARKLGLRQVVALADQRGLSAVTLNTLGTLERGSTKHADPELLHALAELYKIPYEQLVSGYVLQKYGVVSELKHKKIDEPVTSLVHDIGVSSALPVQETYAHAHRGTHDAEPPDVRSPLIVAEELHAHAAALTELALRIARDAGRAARGRSESPPISHASPESLPKRATGRRRNRR
jgi:transcriptional regulator with XRE-family HTH domain